MAVSNAFIRANPELDDPEIKQKWKELGEFRKFVAIQIQNMSADSVIERDRQIQLMRRVTGFVPTIKEEITGAG